MNLFKLNDRENGRPVWVNLDHVTDLRSVRAYDNRYYTRIHVLHGVKSIDVTETPEQIMQMINGTAVKPKVWA